MKIISWNVNGLRAIYKKNFLQMLEDIKPDILCLQEIKIQKDQVPTNLLNDSNHLNYFNFGTRKGYAGVAVFTKIKPLKVISKIELERFDKEGRSLILEFPEFILFNLYLPHGGREKENLEYKIEVYDYLLKFLKKYKEKKVILTGDFNVAHKEIDLARPKDNKNNIMFTLEERSRLDKLIELGLVDTFRCFNGDGGNYTWWPYYRNCRERNLGWRIDYIFVSRKTAGNLKDAFILKNIPSSDHCPVGVEIE